MDEDFTAEWKKLDGEIVDFRITKGAMLYPLPWYRRLLMRFIGRSHLRKQRWTTISIHRPQPPTSPHKPQA
jgi:hypothetical protein